MAENELTREFKQRCETMVLGFDELLSGRASSLARPKIAIARNWNEMQRIVSDLARATQIPHEMLNPTSDFAGLDLNLDEMTADEMDRLLENNRERD